MKLLQTFLQEDGTKRYRINVPNFIAEHEDFDHFEKDRFLSMEKNLRKGDILFDVGTELGWQSAIYSGFVGPENMCLFEPDDKLWPTIKELWGMNQLSDPLSCYAGLVSDRYHGHLDLPLRCWPKWVNGKPLEQYSNWAAVHSFSGLPEMSLDFFVTHLGIVPAAVTIDVEGAEGRVLEGALSTLSDLRPLVWVSIHPEVRLAKYGTCKKRIKEFMSKLGYSEQYLGIDHEEHYFFYPKHRKVVLVDSPWRTNGSRNFSFEEKIPNWQDPWDVERATW